MDETARAALAAMLGHAVVAATPIDRGHIANLRYRVELDDGMAVFVKIPTSPFTTAVLADERAAYEALGDHGFLPRYLGGTDDLLAVEHVEDARWPPPWQDGDLGAALRLLERIAAVEAPAELRSLEHDARHRTWWQVAAKPGPFLSLGVCDRRWFEASIDALVATDACPLGGAALVHGDFRSDNLCVRHGEAIAVDWGAAARGRPDYDVTAFAISYALETAQPPEVVAPDPDPALVGVFAGMYGHAAGLMSIPAPIRDHLHAQLRVALRWCARSLGLDDPSPDESS